ncbi:glutathione synthetase [Anopheles sinensis]|uniref:Glutathione synthetase n=1 Tax=Anopheles sinensis TaxID=74873 RepID=A0A084VQK8_ANOSI|nr:glutathione synthetase [Anopheles sinensis]
MFRLLLGRLGSSCPPHPTARRRCKELLYDSSRAHLGRVHTKGGTKVDNSVEPCSERGVTAMGTGCLYVACVSVCECVRPSSEDDVERGSTLMAQAVQGVMEAKIVPGRPVCTAGSTVAMKESVIKRDIKKVNRFKAQNGETRTVPLYFPVGHSASLHHRRHVTLLSSVTDTFGLACRLTSCFYSINLLPSRDRPYGVRLRQASGQI